MSRVRQATNVRAVAPSMHGRERPVASLPGEAAFEIIDVADLGDRHYDPFVRRIEQFDAELRARLAASQ